MLLPLSNIPEVGWHRRGHLNVQLRNSAVSEVAVVSRLPAPVIAERFCRSAFCQPLILSNFSIDVLEMGRGNYLFCALDVAIPDRGEHPYPNVNGRYVFQSTRNFCSAERYKEK